MRILKLFLLIFTLIGFGWTELPPQKQAMAQTQKKTVTTKKSAKKKVSKKKPVKKSVKKTVKKKAKPAPKKAVAKKPTPKTTTPAKAAPATQAKATEEDESKTGKSVDLSEAFEGKEDKPFKYLPVDPVFWGRVEELEKEGNFVTLIAEGARQEEQFGSSSLEGAEGQFVRGKAFLQRGLSQAAFFTLSLLARERVGSIVGEASLMELGELTKKYGYDQVELQELFDSTEFVELHPDIQSFVSFHKGLSNLQYGFNNWAKAHLSRVKEGSHWDYLLKYWTAVGEIARERIENAEKIFGELRGVEDLAPKLKEQVDLQFARLQFEKANFTEAYDIYFSLKDLGVREIGRIILERAWTKYYMKDYSKALGLLKALKAPYFSPSMTPERHILEMIIYKELCHYESVEEIAKEFRQNFGGAIRHIKRRKPLRENQVLFNMSVMNRDYQEVANLIDRLRTERAEFEEYSWEDFSFFDPTLQYYAQLDELLQDRMDRVLEDEARIIANELLDYEEQVLFLEYTATLDKLRVVRRGEEREYSSEKVSLVTFEKIYWPVGTEYWWDEFEDFKVLISSKCGRDQDSNSKELDVDDLERNFE